MHIVILGSSPNISNVKVKYVIIIHYVNYTKYHVAKMIVLYWILNVMSILCYIYMFYRFIFLLYQGLNLVNEASLFSFLLIYNNKGNKVQIWKDNHGDSRVYR